MEFEGDDMSSQSVGVRCGRGGSEIGFARQYAEVLPLFLTMGRLQVSIFRDPNCSKAMLEINRVKRMCHALWCVGLANASPTSWLLVVWRRFALAEFDTGCRSVQPSVPTARLFDAFLVVQANYCLHAFCHLVIAKRSSVAWSAVRAGGAF